MHSLRHVRPRLAYIPSNDTPTRWILPTPEATAIPNPHHMWEYPRLAVYLVLSFDVQFQWGYIPLGMTPKICPVYQALEDSKGVTQAKVTTHSCRLNRKCPLLIESGVP